MSRYRATTGPCSLKRQSEEVRRPTLRRTRSSPGSSCGDVERRVQQGERLRVEGLEAHARLLEQPRCARPRDARHADGEDLGGDAVPATAEHLGVHHGLAGRKQAELAVLDLQRGEDAGGRQGGSDTWRMTTSGLPTAAITGWPSAPAAARAPCMAWLTCRARRRCPPAGSGRAPPRFLGTPTLQRQRLDGPRPTSRPTTRCRRRKLRVICSRDRGSASAETTVPR